MEQIKFFKGRFTIVPLLATLQKHGESYQLLREQWEQFAYNLNLSTDEVNSLEKKLRDSEAGNRDVNIVREIFRRWKCQGVEANLKVLLEALRDLDLDELADLVRDEFAEARPALAPRRSSRLSFCSAPCRMSPPLQADEDADVNDSLNRSLPRYLIFSEYKGKILLFQAILEGQSVSEIEKLLQDHHADYVNIKEDDAEGCRNAAHVVIESLIHGVNGVEQAVEILNLLVDHGFRGINDGDIYGCTPLHLLMWMGVEEANELNELLEWFVGKGANINAVDRGGSSALLLAFWKENEVTIMKLLELGANPGVTNSYGANAVHIFSSLGNSKLLKLFIEGYKLDVNKRTTWGDTPLHALFEQENIDYQHCLEVMLKNGSKFDGKNNEGLVPLVHWIKSGTSDRLFSTLMQMKAKLPMTEEIASLTLTAIVEGIEKLQRFLPSTELKDANNNTQEKDFSRFVRFLLKIKAKLLLKSDNDEEDVWMRNDWTEVNQILNTKEFAQVLHEATDQVQWDRVKPIRFTKPGKFGFPTTQGIYCTIRAGYVLYYLLDARMYAGFIRICEILKPFCELK